MSEQMKAPVEAIPVASAEPAIAEEIKAPSELDTRLEQLSRKEQSLRMQARKLQEQQKAFEEQQAKAIPKPEFDWKGRLKNNFVDAIAEAGLTQEEITQQLMNTSNSDIAIKQLNSKIAELEAKLGETNNKFDEGSKTAYEQAVKQVKREVSLLVQADEAYETIKATDSQDAVVALIEQTYKEDGELMSVEEAAKQVEDYLVEQALTLSRLKKIQSRKEEAAPTAQPTETPRTQQTQTKTLTHAITQSSKSSGAKDRRERAIAAFQGQKS